MKFEIIENLKDCVKIKVTLSKRRFASDPKEEANTNTVMNFLRENGVRWSLVDQHCENNKLLISNYSPNLPSEGVWVFRNPGQVSKPSPPKPSTRKRRNRAATKKEPPREENKLLGTEDME